MFLFSENFSFFTPFRFPPFSRPSNSFSVCFSLATQQEHWIRKREISRCISFENCISSKRWSTEFFSVCLNSAIQPEVIVLWYMKFLPCTTENVDSTTLCTYIASEMDVDSDAKHCLNPSEWNFTFIIRINFVNSTQTVHISVLRSAANRNGFGLDDDVIMTVNVFFTLLYTGPGTQSCLHTFCQTLWYEMVMFVNH